MSDIQSSKKEENPTEVESPLDLNFQESQKIYSGQESSLSKAEFDSYSLGLVLLQHIEGQLERADNKAQFTLTINALLVASTTVWNLKVYQAIPIGNASLIDIMTLGGSVLLLAVLILATLLAMTAVIPRLAPPEKAQNIFYFGTIIKTPEQRFHKSVIEKPQKEITELLYSEIHVLAEIAEKKYMLIRRSFILLFAAAGIWIFLQILVIFSPLP